MLYILHKPPRYEPVWQISYPSLTGSDWWHLQSSSIVRWHWMWDPIWLLPVWLLRWQFLWKQRTASSATCLLCIILSRCGCTLWIPIILWLIYCKWPKYVYICMSQPQLSFNTSRNKYHELQIMQFCLNCGLCGQCRQSPFWPCSVGCVCAPLMKYWTIFPVVLLYRYIHVHTETVSLWLLDYMRYFLVVALSQCVG